MRRFILSLWLVAVAAPAWADYSREDAPEWSDDDEPEPTCHVPKGVDARDRAASNARSRKIRERNNAVVVACTAGAVGIAVALGATKLMREIRKTRQPRVRQPWEQEPPQPA